MGKRIGGLPPNDFYGIRYFVRRIYLFIIYRNIYSRSAAGTSKEWADKLQLSTDVIIGVGAFDAHMGAVGGQIRTLLLSKVMGTSTCDMLVAPTNESIIFLVKGICGQVDVLSFPV